jgi:hypothetical protein
LPLAAEHRGKLTEGMYLLPEHEGRAVLRLDRAEAAAYRPEPSGRRVLAGPAHRAVAAYCARFSGASMPFLRPAGSAEAEWAAVELLRKTVRTGNPWTNGPCWTPLCRAGNW